MVISMDIVNCILAIMYIVALGCVLYYINKFQMDKLKRNSKPINKVHFYVARDSDDALYLYLSKPVRRDGFWGTGDNSLVIGGDANFFLEKCGLKWEDFKSLKWEDEPVEVFLNLED